MKYRVLIEQDQDGFLRVPEAQSACEDAMKTYEFTVVIERDGGDRFVAVVPALQAATPKVRRSRRLET
jgi:predicted RNase H-like HicB family nuclease